MTIRSLRSLRKIRLSALALFGLAIHAWAGLIASADGSIRPTLLLPAASWFHRAIQFPASGFAMGVWAWLGCVLLAGVTEVVNFRFVGGGERRHRS